MMQLKKLNGIIRIGKSSEWNWSNMTSNKIFAIYILTGIIVYAIEYTNYEDKFCGNQHYRNAYNHITSVSFLKAAGWPLYMIHIASTNIARDVKEMSKHG